MRVNSTVDPLDLVRSHDSSLITHFSEFAFNDQEGARQVSTRDIHVKPEEWEKAYQKVGGKQMD